MFMVSGIEYKSIIDCIKSFFAWSISDSFLFLSKTLMCNISPSKSAPIISELLELIAIVLPVLLDIFLTFITIVEPADDAGIRVAKNKSPSFTPSLRAICPLTIASACCTTISPLTSSTLVGLRVSSVSISLPSFIS